MKRQTIIILMMAAFVCGTVTTLTSCDSTPTEEIFNKGKAAYDQENYEEAFKYFSEAADKGNADAQALLSQMYFKGEGVAQDYKKGLEWAEKSMDNGNAELMFYFVKVYNKGWEEAGIEEDFDKAAELLEKSAELGYYDAQILLAQCYSRGAVFPQDKQKAKYWLEQAAKQEPDGEAQELLKKLEEE